MNAIRQLIRLARNQSGAAAVEFALLGPIFITMLIGVLQTGMILQNYNALRNVSADVARHAMVQDQTGNNLTLNQIRTYALGSAQGAPYLLRATRVNAAVLAAGTQRVEGARELELTITYQSDSLLEFAGINGPFLSYERPIFLLD